MVKEATSLTDFPYFYLIPDYICILYKPFYTKLLEKNSATKKTISNFPLDNSSSYQQYYGSSGNRLLAILLVITIVNFENTEYTDSNHFSVELALY
ncbi:hypothetical protein D920_00302 [Enterococcus faecalis 13-SD-W-01]|nr:hypothetical protein D920_00302 [Enterococcus faecalis 13-SD-W-01]